MSDSLPERARIDPKTGRQLPEGIRYRAGRDRYETRVRFQDPLGEWHERTSSHRTVTEAKKALYKTLGSETKPASGRTLNEWKEEYWPVVGDSIRPRTRAAYLIGWRLRVQPTLGRMRLRDIDSIAVEAAMVAWSGTASTKIDALSMLSRLLEGARKKGLVSYNPARDIERPRQDESDLRSRALSPEQVELVLSMIPEGKYRRYAAALVYTGGRSGEATAARVIDVDLEARVIRVRRSISPGEHGELIEQSPKSHKWRPVPIIDAFLPYVEEAMRGKKPQDRLFDGARGGHLTNRTFVRAVDWPKIRAKLDRPDFKVHDLRHTFATLMLDAGVPAHDVQEMMGHSTLQVTERYGRSREGAAARAIPKANAVFRGPSAGQGFSGVRNAAARRPKTPGGPGV